MTLNKYVTLICNDGPGKLQLLLLLWFSVHVCTCVCMCVCVFLPMSACAASCQRGHYCTSHPVKLYYFNGSLKASYNETKLQENQTSLNSTMNLLCAVFFSCKEGRKLKHYFLSDSIHELIFHFLENFTGLPPPKRFCFFAPVCRFIGLFVIRIM